MVNRSVIGISVTTSYVSVVKLRENDPKPRLGHVDVPEGKSSSHTVATTCHHIVAMANKVVADLVSAGAAPDLVAMTKPSWNAMFSDPSAYRRSALYFCIVNALCDKQIPVAEIPLLTVMKWASVTARYAHKKNGEKVGVDGVAELEAQVRTNYPDLPRKENFRLTTVAIAAAGAMGLAGFETPWAVTQERLNLLTGYSDEKAKTRINKAIQWPGRVQPPRSLAEWYTAGGSTNEKEEMTA
jgi:hypothetical protein